MRWDYFPVHFPMGEPWVGCCDHATARALALNQLGASACGQTAIYTALLMLKVLDPSVVHSLDWSLAVVRKRANDAPLPQYLRSRFDAGCTGEELVTSLNRILTHHHLVGLVRSEGFLPFRSINPVSLVDYLADLFNSGHVVIATFNLQVLGNDAWHHQVVYGVDRVARTVYCTNPIEPYPEELAVQFLSTDSVLLVRREDVLQRVDVPGADPDLLDRPEWRRLMVAEQVHRLQSNPDTPFIVIPAAEALRVCTYFLELIHS